MLALLGAAAQWVMNVVNNRIVFCVTRDTRAEAFATCKSSRFLTSTAIPPATSSAA